MGNTTGKPIVQDGIIKSEENARYSATTEQILKTVAERQSQRQKQSTAKKTRRNPADYIMITDPSETVDGGYLYPQGVYQGKQDFNVKVVRKAIIRRQLAPFYKGLDFVGPDISDEDLLDTLDLPLIACDPERESIERSVSRCSENSHSTSNSVEKLNSSRDGPSKDQLIWLYRNVLECPICFLEYPRLNDTRCCRQQICTECFVNIRRNPAHPPYSVGSEEACDVVELVSEPAACPFCAQSDLGVTFEAPPFEWGVPSKINSNQPGYQKVITIDMIRPDWEEKLNKARRKLAKKTAHARALHMSALIPNEESAPSRNESTASKSAESSRRSSRASIGDKSDTRTRSGSGSLLKLSCGSWKTRDEDDVSEILKTNKTFPDMMKATRTLSPAQLRVLEERMIEQATKASLSA